MIVIADSNIFYSALITPQSTIAKILKEKRNIQFFVSYYLIEEIHEHSHAIALALGKSRKKVLSEFRVLLNNVEIIENKNIPKQCIHQAIDIVKEIDIDDTFFAALHLHTKHKIWCSVPQPLVGLRVQVKE